MSAIIGEGVSLRGLRDEGYNYTWNITGACVAADVSKAVTQDLTAANSAKLATTGSTILGTLASFEDRVQEGIKVGTVARKGVFVWTYDGPNPTLGVGVVGGATAGYVKAYIPVAAQEPIVGNVVIDVDTVNKLVTVLFD